MFSIIGIVAAVLLFAAGPVIATHQAWAWGHRHGHGGFGFPGWGWGGCGGCCGFGGCWGNVPYLVMGMATGFALTYFYGFLIALILNTAIWVTISYMIRNYVKRSTGTSGLFLT